MDGPSAIAPSAGFPPIARADAEILILGSLPGRRSIAEGQYYAHPQNAFWRIMAELYGVGETYDERCRGMIEAGIAVWDVLRQSVRPGSLDADIRLDSARANDFGTFFERHVAIRRVCFNGLKAEALFRRFVLPAVANRALELVTLPSTSPAHASLSFDDKLRKWRRGLRDD